MQSENEPVNKTGSRFIQIASLVSVMAILLFATNDQLSSFFDKNSLKASLAPAFSATTQMVTKSTAVSTIPTNKYVNIFFVSPIQELKIHAPKFNIFEPGAKTQNIPTIVKTPTVKTPVQLLPTPKTPILPTISAPRQNKIESIINSIPTYESQTSNPALSVVQILCKITEGKTIKNISSSGVIISDTGLILTNAHVGIHPFLDAHTNNPVTCILKHGNPATTVQQLDFIYISPNWTKRHKGEINGALSSDTGESDFAILKTDNVNKGSNIRHVVIKTPENRLNLNLTDLDNTTNINNISKGQPITLIAYPILNNPISLPQKQESLVIEDMYSFGNNPSASDLIETSISSIGKSGASGGAILSQDKTLIGIIANIVPSTSANSTKVHGISIEHINNELLDQTGISFYSLLTTDGSSLKNKFNSLYLDKVTSDLLN